MEKTTKEYPRIKFEVISQQHCCGVIIVGGFYLEEPYRDWYSGRTKPAKVWPSLEDQLADFTTRFEGDLSQYIADGNNHNGQYILQATFTDRQPEGLEAHFVKSGWKLDYKWKNHNSGNEVRMYSKRLSNKEIRALIKEHNFEYEEEY